jgi:hypothetical protein
MSVLKDLYDSPCGYLLIPQGRPPGKHPLDFSPNLADDCQLGDDDFDWYGSPIIRDRDTAFKECAKRNQHTMDNPPKEDGSDVHWWMVYELGLYSDATVIADFEPPYSRLGVGCVNIHTKHAIMPVRPTSEELAIYTPKNDFQAKPKARTAKKASVA